MKSARILTVVAALALAACGDSRQGVGNVSSIIVVVPDSVWEAVGDSVLTALEPPVFSARNERTFEVTQIAPTASAWTDLRRFRQILAIGTPTDPWVEPALKKADASGEQSGVVQASDVWARNQLVTAVVVPAGNAAAAARAQVPRVAEVIDSAFRAYAIRRMYTSQPDTMLRDSLRRSMGIGILLPRVYTRVAREGDVRLYQNSTQIGGDLVRSVLITSRPGAAGPTPEQAIAWRDSIAGAVYRPAQVRDEQRIETAPVTVGESAGIEIQGLWEGTDPAWPTSGPFITRVFPCPAQDRTYLVDTWLYAPSRSKYEYIIQLQTILGTLECA